MLGHSGFNTCQSAVVAVEGNFPSKLPSVHPHELESEAEWESESESESSVQSGHSSKFLQNNTANTSFMENDVADDGIQDIPVKNYFLNSDNEENESSSSNFSNYSYTGNTDEDHEFGTNCYDVHLNCVYDSFEANNVTFK